MAQKAKVVKVKSWDDLPEVLEPGEYHVGGERFTIVEPVEKEFMRMAISGIKKLHERYYGH